MDSAFCVGLKITPTFDEAPAPGRARDGRCSAINPGLTIAVSLLAAVLGLVVGYVARRLVAEARIASAEAQARKIKEDALREAEARRREALLEAKEDTLRLRNELERESRERRAELQKVERRLFQKEEQLDRKLAALEVREQDLAKHQADLERVQREVAELKHRQLAELERISGMTAEEARQALLARAEEEVSQEVARVIREAEFKAREEAERRSRMIMADAIQRCSADHTAELTVSVVQLPSDEMKGRIIGREGRNIRTLETLTGINLIIDDTPEAVILSGFDPIRREVARVALEHLIADGRIHPARIEEAVSRAQREIEQRIREEGEQACFQLGVNGMHPELVKLLGRLKFRHSYGQNVLKHSIEVALLAGTMAAELGADAQVARRAGLIHDIGKAVDHQQEGTHVQIGIDLARKYKEDPAVIHAFACHHGDHEPETVEAFLVSAADAISASRPGARRETLEAYIRRLEKLEAIATSFEGVEKAYAIQAGREIRVMVKPDRLDDLAAVRLARDISKKIQSELTYPGQIKVTVIRETRAVEYAR